METESIKPILESIAQSLAVLADYVEQRRIKESGERTFTIGGFVRGENNGGELVHLYEVHPKLDKRVSVVYAEKWPELPFDPNDAPLYTGEAAPSKAFAQKSGAFQPVEPFKIVTKPTERTTDAGLTIYKFDRVLGTPHVGAVSEGETEPKPEHAPAEKGDNGEPRKANEQEVIEAKTLIKGANKGVAVEELRKIAARWASSVSNKRAQRLEDLNFVEIAALIVKLRAIHPKTEPKSASPA